MRGSKGENFADEQFSDKTFAHFDPLALISLPF